MMDKNGKLFGKISIVDIAVILVLVVGVCGIFYTKAELDKGNVLSNDGAMLIKSSAKTDVLEVALKIENVRDITRDAIVVGDEVYITATNKLLGNVVRVESKPHKTDAMTDEGVIYKTAIPERFDVTIVVETAGKKKPEGYFTSNNFHLYYGKSIEVKTSTIQTNPTICGITVIENAQ